MGRDLGLCHPNSQYIFEKADPLVEQIQNRLKKPIKDKKFPYNWIGQKIKFKWGPEIVIHVLEQILQAPLEKIVDPYPYFDSVWKIEAQNQRARLEEQAHERRKKDEKDNMQDILSQTFKKMPGGPNADV